MKRMLVLALLFFSAIAHPEEEQSIYDRADKVKVRLEILNSLGMDCDAELSVKGMKGAASPVCEKFLNNMRGDYFKATMDECVKLSKWYESKRAFISANKNYAQTNPSEAKDLVRDMKAVNTICDTDTMSTRYEFLMKPINKINALTELQ